MRKGYVMYIRKLTGYVADKKKLAVTALANNNSVILYN